VFILRTKERGRTKKDWTEESSAGKRKRTKVAASGCEVGGGLRPFFLGGQISASGGHGAMNLKKKSPCFCMTRPYVI